MGVLSSEYIMYTHGGVWRVWVGEDVVCAVVLDAGGGWRLDEADGQGEGDPGSHGAHQHQLAPLEPAGGTGEGLSWRGSFLKLVYNINYNYVIQIS